MTIQLAQYTVAGFPVVATTVYSYTLATPTASGNMAVFSLGELNPGQVPTYVTLGTTGMTVAYTASSTSGNFALWFTAAGIPSGSTVITVRNTSGLNEPVFAYWEFSGVNAVDTFTGVLESNGFSGNATYNSGTVATNYANEAWLGYAVSGHVVGIATAWTSSLGGNADYNQCGGYQIVSSTGNMYFSGTVAGTGGNNLASVLSLYNSSPPPDPAVKIRPYSPVPVFTASL